MTVQVGHELVGKWLELLVEVLPRARQIGMLRVLSPWGAAQLGMLRAAAERRADAPTIDDFPVHDATEVPSTLEAIKQAKPDALVVDNDVTLVSKAPEIGAVGLPAISGSQAISRMPVCSSATVPAFSTSFAISRAISTTS